MDYKKLQSTIKEIHLTDEQKTDLIRKCTLRYNEEDSKMKKNVSFISFKKPMTAVAALAICLCLAVGTFAASKGFFKDIVRPDGAVTGTEYLRLTEELIITVEYISDKVNVEIHAKDNDIVPFSEIEQLSLDVYTITDENGKVIFKGAKTDWSDFTDGVAEIQLNANKLDTGKYTLSITRLSDGKKRDSPLVIKGEWKCEFTV